MLVLGRISPLVSHGYGCHVHVFKTGEALNLRVRPNRSKPILQKNHLKLVPCGRHDGSEELGIQLHEIKQSQCFAMKMFGRSLCLKYVHLNTNVKCVLDTKHLVKLDLMTFPLIPCINLFVSVHAMIQVSFQRN